MRTVQKATIDKGGMPVIENLIAENLNNLVKLLEWNVDNGIRLFRVGGDVFPWLGTYSIDSLSNLSDVEYMAGFVGEFAREHDIRLTFHPGPFNVLCSPNPEVVNKTIAELDAHSQIFDMMGFDPSHYNKINIHVGGVYGDKVSALERWSQNYLRLSESTRKRLTIENDDKPNMYSVQDLYGLYELCDGKLPIVFDYFHHRFHTDGLSEQEALELAISTWPSGITPVTHYSESRREEHTRVITDICRINGIDLDNLHDWPTLYEQYVYYSTIKYQAHSDLVDGPIETYGNRIDVVVEAKAKEQAVLGLLDSEKKSKIRENFYLGGCIIG